MFKQIFLPLLGVAIFVVVVGSLSQGRINIQSLPSKEVTQAYKTIKIGAKEVKIEVAKTDAERQKGLSNRKNLAQDSGMLFAFTPGSKPIFWMKDTLIPLDIIWIRNGKIVGINKNVPTEIGLTETELTRYKAPQPIDYVLEVNAGFSDKNNISTGQTISGLEQL